MRNEGIAEPAMATRCNIAPLLQRELCGLEREAMSTTNANDVASNELTPEAPSETNNGDRRCCHTGRPVLQETPKSNLSASTESFSA
jgi:hypothetical protein